MEDGGEIKVGRGGGAVVAPLLSINATPSDFTSSRPTQRALMCAVEHTWQCLQNEMLLRHLWDNETRVAGHG